MYRHHVLLRPQVAGYGAVALLSCAGALTFLLLLLELSPPAWSRPALALQGLAVVLALLLTYWYRPPRFFLYPIVLAGVIYLWDTTLPPPSLPEGPLRWLIPRAVLVGLIADVLVTLRRQRRLPRTGTPVYGRYMDLKGVARVLDTTPEDLRARLRRAGRITVVHKAGAEFLSLDDLYLVLAQWNQPDERLNGKSKGCP